ncbi:MAG TPA: hypothetical protein ENK18_03850 [Deltaproteobacteria bacterium]|nr:hypothetical protein [Deltaproteobacteria bacterium]
MILVLSTGRSGTKSFADYLDRSPRLHAVHEAEPLLIDEVIDTLRGDRPPGALAEQLRTSRAPVVGGREYAESNHILSYAIPSLEAAFPGIRYLWLIRDGRDVVASLDVRGVLHDQPRADVRGGWLMERFRLDWFDDAPALAWDTLPPFEKACWYWEWTNAVIEDSLASIDEARWLQLRLEHIGTERHQLARRFELPTLSEHRPPIINQSRQKLTRWQGWSPPQIETFTRVCGDRMDRVYPGWRNPDGSWRPVWTPPLHTRIQLRAQALAREVVYGDGLPSRALLRLGRRFPTTLKLRARAVLGLR